MKKEKTLFAYTASEENAFEICRTTGEQKDTLAAIRLDMIDDGLTEDEAEREVETLKADLEKDGYAYVIIENAAEYDIVYGVAYHGSTKPVTDYIKELRHEIVSMF